MSPLRVAVVGAGAAGMYAVQHLLEQTALEVRIDLFEYLPTPWGLIRTGVAPDHPEKKQITDRLFELYLKHEKVRFFGNVRLGSDLSHQDLAARYHAVVYAVGANDDRLLGISGEDMSGSWSARQFVAWYNGHPDYRDLRFDLSHRRAVIVGTGNVALDVARILTLSPAELARSDIADHALAQLRASHVREVVLLGRRGCHHGAFNNPELEELLHLDGVQVGVEAEDLYGPEPDTWEARRKVSTLRQLAARRVSAAQRRIVFKFDHAPVSLTGTDRVTGIQARTPSASILLSCGLVLRAIGYRGTALPGIPFDDETGVIPNVAGRVTDASGPCPGIYVTGWIKRGPRGVIGSNKRCAAETIANLLVDAEAGLSAPPESTDIGDLLASRGCGFVTYGGWQRIDRLERRAGWAQGRPRIKQTQLEDLLAIASPEPATSHRGKT